MSIKYIDDNINIYIIKEKINNINIDNEKELENYLKKLFKILKSKYSIVLEGFYNVNIYVDKFYGIVICLEKEKLDYYNYYNDEVDMRISIKSSIFLYQIDNYKKGKKIHIIDNNMYLEVTDSKDLIYVIENCNNILYDYGK